MPSNDKINQMHKKIEYSFKEIMTRQKYLISRVVCKRKPNFMHAKSPFWFRDWAQKFLLDSGMKPQNV